MSHELDMSKGFAAMAYRGEVPWHGMGQVIQPGDPLEVILEKGGLDWEAVVVPSQYEFNGKLMVAPNSFHMVRSDTGDSLSVMSKRYKPHQPADIMAFYQQYVLLDPRFEIETCGALKGGRNIFCMAKYSEKLLVNGEEHWCYLLFTTSFDGSVATRVIATLVRVVCWNTMSAAQYMANQEKAYIAIRHNVDFSTKAAQEEAAEKFAGVISEFDKYKRMGEALAGIKLAGHQVEGLFRKLTTDKAAKGDMEREEAPTGRARAALERLLQSYRDTLQEGTPGNTGWAALQGVTRYVDWNRTVRDTENDGKAGAKFASSMFGSGASLKREAVQLIAEVGNVDLAEVTA